MKVICTKRQKEMIIDVFSGEEGCCLISKAREVECKEAGYDCKKCLEKNIEWESEEDERF